MVQQIAKKICMVTQSSTASTFHKRKQRFTAKYVQSDNVLCQLFAHVESL